MAAEFKLLRVGQNSGVNINAPDLYQGSVIRPLFRLEQAVLEWRWRGRGARNLIRCGAQTELPIFKGDAAIAVLIHQYAGLSYLGFVKTIELFENANQNRRQFARFVEIPGLPLDPLLDQIAVVVFFVDGAQRKPAQGQNIGRRFGDRIKGVVPALDVIPEVRGPGDGRRSVL